MAKNRRRMAKRIKSTQTIHTWACRCERCGYEWESKGEEPPKSCADCKTRSWDVPPGTKAPGPVPRKRRGE